MAEVSQSAYCCGVYEMGELEVPEKRSETWDFDTTPTYDGCKTLKEWFNREIKEALSSAVAQSQPKRLVPAIWFADTDKGGYGFQWAKELRKRGYAVKRIPVGLNDKSGNKISMWIWFTDKKKRRK